MPIREVVTKGFSKDGIKFIVTAGFSLGSVVIPTSGAGAGGGGLDWQQQNTARRTSSGANAELERKAKRKREEEDLLIALQAIAAGWGD